MKFLANHPNRGFQPNDMVIHAGTNKNQRGRIGTVYRSYHQNYVNIHWHDKRNCSTATYSWEFAINNFAVAISCLNSNSPNNFDGPKYVKKYRQYAITTSDLYSSENELINHQQMKRMVDGLYRLRNLKAMVQTEQLALNFTPQSEKELDMTTEKITSSVFVFRVENNSIASTPKLITDSIANAVTALENYANSGGVGDFVIMEPVKRVSIKPVQQFSMDVENM